MADLMKIMEGDNLPIESNTGKSLLDVMEGPDNSESPGFTELFAPPEADNSPMELADYGTTFEPTAKQRMSERSAATELRRIKYRMRQAGKGEELEQFIEKGGREGAVGTLDYLGENVLTPTFDLLSAGNYAFAGGVSEMLRTGSAWEGFKQAGVEFADAMPIIEVDGARKTTFDDVFNENGVDFWGSSVAALALDIVLDPINLLPGGAIAKGLSKVGGKALTKSGKAGEVFERLFLPERALDMLGEVGEAAKTERMLAETGVARDFIGIEKRVDRLTANMNPAERVLFGLYMDQPDKLYKQAEALVNTGLLDKARLPEVKDNILRIKKFTDAMFRREVKHGVLDQHMYRDNYVYGIEAVDPSLRRAFDQALRDRGQGTGLVTNYKAPFARPRKTTTQEERLRLILQGEIGATSTELDIGNILLQRGVDHARWVNTRKFLDGVVSDGRIVASKKLNKNFLNSNEYSTWKAEVQQLNPGMDVLEVRGPGRHKPSDKSKKGIGQSYEELVGAYVMPKPIVDTMKKADAAFRHEDDLGWFFEQAEKLTGPWRGWATLSFGFHARNYTGMLFNNWLAGVGGKEVDVSKYIFGDDTMRLGTLGVGFVKRHMEALKLQAVMEGTGKLPAAAKWAADKIVGKGGIGGLSLPNLTVDGKKIKSWEELGRLAEKYDVTQTVSKISGTKESAHFNPWRTGVEGIDIAKVRGAGLDPTAQEAFEIVNKKSASIGESATKVFGRDFPALKFNRAAATMVENNGRVALFIDRLLKGDAPEVAAQATKKWHFDYRRLSNVEKKVFATAMPFYAWQRFALPRMAMAVVENPGRVARIPKVYRAIENLRRDWQDLPTPDYYSEVQMLQLWAMNDNKQPLFAQVDLPILELNRVNQKDVIGSLNPFVKMWFERTSNTNFFLGSDIESFPGEEEPVADFFGMPLTKTERHFIGSLAPPTERFLFRPQEAAARGQLGEYYFREITGIALRPLDIRRVLRGKTFQHRKLAKQFEAKAKQEQERAKKAAQTR
jgi:hypothetical protein